MEIARHLSSFTPESLAYIKRLVRGATDTPLAQGLLLERRLFMKLCLGDAALSRMRVYDEQDSASPSRVGEVHGAGSACGRASFGLARLQIRVARHGLPSRRPFRCSQEYE